MRIVVQYVFKCEKPITQNCFVNFMQKQLKDQSAKWKDIDDASILEFTDWPISWQLLEQFVSRFSANLQNTYALELRPIFSKEYA